MCTKTSKTPLLLIGGVCFVIVLVGITGVTLINNLNLSNIIKLNEKVASDSMSSHDAELRDINYANNHPKNIYKFDEFSAPYALAVGTHPQSLPAAAAQSSVVAAAAAYLTGAEGALQQNSASSVVEAGGASLIGRPTVALVDAAANSGNAASAHAIMQSTGRQQALEPTHNTLLEHERLQSRDTVAVGSKLIAATTNENANVSAELVNNPQVNTTAQSDASILAIAIAAHPAPSNRSSFSAEASINSSAPSASLSSVASPSVSDTASSVNVDIAAKLMLPLILNGSARLTPGFSNGNRQMNANEEQEFAIDTLLSLKSDNGTKDISVMHQSKNVFVSSGRLVVPAGGEGVDKEKRDYVVKVKYIFI